MENTKVSLFSNIGCNEKSRLAASLFIFKSLNLFQNLRLRMSPSENWRHLNLSQPSLIYALWCFCGFSIKGKPMVSNQFITQIYLFYFFWSVIFSRHSVLHCQWPDIFFPFPCHFCVFSFYSLYYVLPEEEHFAFLHSSLTFRILCLFTSIFF